MKEEEAVVDLEVPLEVLFAEVLFIMELGVHMQAKGIEENKNRNNN